MRDIDMELWEAVDYCFCVMSSIYTRLIRISSQASVSAHLLKSFISVSCTMPFRLHHAPRQKHLSHFCRQRGSENNNILIEFRLICQSILLLAFFL